MHILTKTRWALLASSALLLAACAPKAPQSAMPAHAPSRPAMASVPPQGVPMDYAAIQPAAAPMGYPTPPMPQPMAMLPVPTASFGPGFAAPQPAPNLAVLQQTMSELDNMRDRVRRAERAMIRLDQRMQLLEEKELTRMTDPAALEPAAGAALPQQMSQAAPANPAFGGVMMEDGARLMPMAFNPNPSLGTMPHNRAVLGVPAARNTVQSSGADVLNSARLPSLADGAKQPVATSQVEIWTIEYNDGKVWPEREQLLQSGNVVGLIRDQAPVTIFARGAEPTSRTFRERVRALSQYLGQVSNRESLPIATLPATHLPNDTLELVVTRQ